MSEFEIKIPFVVTTSVGGPYDDDAYAAGWEAAQVEKWLGAVDALACAGSLRPALPFHTENVPQIDLVAMGHGWKMTVEDSIDGWAYCTFEKGAP